MDKSATRRDRLAARRALAPEEAARLGACIFSRVSELPEVAGAECVLANVSSKDNEVDTHALIGWLLSRERLVLVPVAQAGGVLVWSRLFALDELVPQRFGILEPRPGLCRPTPPPPAAVCIVPGVAFTRDGWRIGYGGGYFDRFLVGFPGAKVALAYEVQMVDHIPAASHDIPVDAVVTERAVYWRTQG